LRSVRVLAAPGRVSRQAIAILALLGFAWISSAAFGQGVPIPVEEQVRMFQSLPPAQQQALIRELQQELPPAQRQAILRILQGAEPGEEELAPGEEGDEEEGALDFPSERFDLREEEEPRFAPGSTVVVQFSVPEDGPELDADLAATRQDLLDRLARGNPYTLDGSGQLLLPGIPPIALSGLNEDEATVRVGAEPALRNLVTELTLLPLEPVGFYALEPFGYDLFEGSPSTFAPATDIPVPADYVIGPSDTVYVQLFGNQNTEYFLTVSREGVINFPEIGPLSVSGLTFPDMRAMINERITEQMIGVRASITLGELRSIRIFVLGEVMRPGSYTVSGLSTMTNALFASGGVQTIGSLRNIALRRDGVTISTLDLYDLLMRGDTRGDARLQPGDVIFVSPIGETVAIDGQVRRPAIYEIESERTVADLVALAGGLNANANRSSVKLERIVPGRGTTVEDIDMSVQTGGQQTIRDGDIVRVLPNLAQLENSVRLEGNVFQPGLFQWYPGMRLSNLLPAPELVRPMSDLNYVLIRREREPNVDTDVVSADLAAIWQRRPGANDIALEPRDTVFVFNLDIGRAHIVRPIMDELTAQAPPNAARPAVRIGGQVRAEGEYPLERGMRVSDLLRAGGGLGDDAYAMDAELTRYAVIDGEYRETELVAVDLAGVLRGNAVADVTLAPYDYLNVKAVPRWRGEETISIRGEVVFPGNFPIRRGETLSSALQRAGGLTDLAFPEGSVFTRRELVEREREQLDVLARRIERDLAAISVTDPNSSATISTGQTLITQLREAVATGRLVIRLDDIVRGVREADVILKDGDQLIVPDQQQEVTVLGEVQYATSHVFDRSSTRDDYIAKSGGLTSRADQRRIYVVRANGEVVADSGGRWFQSNAGGVRPGDSIVVPLDVDQPLARWAAISQIIYQMAIAAAAASSFD
jgi:polysaccharide biosynthesis/export protein